MRKRTHHGHVSPSVGRAGSASAPKDQHSARIHGPEWMTDHWKHRVEAAARVHLTRNLRGVKHD